MIRTITLSGAPGYDDVEVRAVCRGDLALHPAYQEVGWRVTHIPTGEAIGHFTRCRNARRAMRHLAPFDWHFLARGDPKYAIVLAMAPAIVRRCGGRI